MEEGSIPDGERLGRAHGGAAELEDEVGRLLAREIEMGRRGKAGAAPAAWSCSCLARPELVEEEERGKMRMWRREWIRAARMEACMVTSAAMLHRPAQHAAWARVREEAGEQVS